MSKQLKKQLTLKGQEVAPHIDATHLQRALFVALTIFALSLTVGLVAHSLLFLLESLLIITLCWGVYRKNFAAILLISLYLLVAKTYQIFTLNGLPLWICIASLFLTLILVREFYLGNKKAVHEENSIRAFGSLFDFVFVLIISLTTLSISTFAMELIK